MFKFRDKKQVFVFMTGISIISQVNSTRLISCKETNTSSRILKCGEVQCKRGFEPEKCTQNNIGSLCKPCPPGHYSRTDTWRIFLHNGECHLKTCEQMLVKYQLSK